MANPTTPIAQQIQRLRNAARAALQQENTEAAVEYYRKLLKLKPDDPEANEQIGLLLGERLQKLVRNADRAMKSRDFEKAREFLHEALRLDSQHKPARQRLRQLRKMEKEKRVRLIVWACTTVLLLTAVFLGAVWVYNALKFDKGTDLLRKGEYAQSRETFDHVGDILGMLLGVGAQKLKVHKEYVDHLIAIEELIEKHEYGRAMREHILPATDLFPEDDYGQTESIRGAWQKAQDNWYEERLKEGREKVNLKEFDECDAILALIAEKGYELEKTPQFKELKKKNQVERLVFDAVRLFEARELEDARHKALEALRINPEHEEALRIKQETRIASISLKKEIENAHDGPVSAVEFSGDAKKVVTSGQDGTLRIWDASNWKMVKKIEVARSEVFDVACSPDGGKVACASRREIRIYSLTGYSLETTLQGHDEDRPIPALAFSPDGKYFGSGSEREIRVWRTAGFSEVGRARSHVGTVTAISFSPDGRFVASAGGTEDRTVRVYRLPAVQEIWKKELDKEVTKLLFSPDGRYLVFGDVDGRIRIHDPQAGFEEVQFGRNLDVGEKITAMAFSPNGKFLVIGTSIGTIRVWETEKFKRAWTKPKAHPAEINGITISDDYVIVSGGFSKLKVWAPE